MLTGSITAVAGMLLSDQTEIQAAPPPNRLPIAVIGAGFGGLACAYELSAAGYSVDVFEARGRLGGRVHSVPEFVPGQTVEFGAELIGANHPLWLKYAKKFGIELQPLPADETLEILLRNKHYNRAEASTLNEQIEKGRAELATDAIQAVWDEPWMTPNAPQFDMMSLADRIKSMQIPDDAKYAIANEFRMDMACDPQKMSYLALLCVIKAHGLEKYWTETESYRCPQGNQVLASRLAEGIRNGRLHFDCPVTQVTSRQDKVAIRIRDGREFEFSDVVLTAPPAVWNRIKFDPPLPQGFLPQMGSATKFMTATNKRFWESGRSASQFTDTLAGITWESNERVSTESAILASFVGGTLADNIHSLPFEKRIPAIHQAWAQILPGYKRHHVKSELIDWIGEPWTQCGYSFPSPGAFLQQAQILRDGIGRLHFAGEHASFGFMGFMEGGLHSGVSVALRLVQRH